MKTNTQLAASSPKNVIFNPYYWFDHQKLFLGLLYVSVAVFIALFRLNFPKLDDPLILVSIFIYGFAIWGIGVVVQGLIKISIEKAIAIRISENLSVELSKIRGKEKDRIDLKKVSELLPTTSDKFKSAMIRLTCHIIDEARDRKFESSDIIMRPYKEEAIGDIFKVNTIQKIALRLGILGTFIGLILAFINIGDLNNIDKNFNQITGALQYSFSTSIAGLEASVMLALFIILLNRQQNDYFKSMEVATQTTIALVRNSINKDTFIASFDQMKESMKEVRDSLYDQQAETKAQTSAIQDGILKLKDAKNNFDEFLFDVTNEMKSVYEILSPEKISEELRLSLESSVQGISSTLENNITNHLASYSQISESMTKLNDALAQIERQLNGQIAFNNESLTKAREEVYTSITSLSDMQENYLTQIAEHHPNKTIQQIFKKIETDLTNGLGQKAKSFLDIISRLESSINSYSGVIESKVPSVSKKKIIFFSAISTLLLSIGGLLVLQLTVPDVLNTFDQFVKSIIGK